VPDKANAVFVASELLAMRSDHPDYQALKMANFIFGGDNSSRLFNRVRQKEGLSYTVSSTFVASAQDAGAKFMLYAICNPQNIDRLDRVIAEELEKLVKQGVRDDELAAAKKAVVQLWTLARSDDASLMSMLVDDLQIGRTFGYDADVERKIAKLTAAEVNQAIRRHLAPDRLVIVRGGDLKAAATKASERKRPVALGQSSK
jgi:zinc protease